MTQKFYVSITGLKVNHVWQLPVFWRHAIASMAQTQVAIGCLDAQSRKINGVHHTRSVWQNRESMLVYLRSGSHLKAMRVFSRIATGKTYGFETTDIPDWEKVHQLWHDCGKEV